MLSTDLDDLTPRPVPIPCQINESLPTTQVPEISLLINPIQNQVFNKGPNLIQSSQFGYNAHSQGAVNKSYGFDEVLRNLSDKLSSHEEHLKRLDRMITSTTTSEQYNGICNHFESRIKNIENNCNNNEFITKKELYSTLDVYDNKLESLLSKINDRTTFRCNCITRECTRKILCRTCEHTECEHNNDAQLKHVPNCNSNTQNDELCGAYKNYGNSTPTYKKSVEIVSQCCGTPKSKNRSSNYYDNNEFLSQREDFVHESNACIKNWSSGTKNCEIPSPRYTRGICNKIISHDEISQKDKYCDNRFSNCKQPAIVSPCCGIPTPSFKCNELCKCHKNHEFSNTDNENFQNNYFSIENNDSPYSNNPKINKPFKDAEFQSKEPVADNFKNSKNTDANKNHISANQFDDSHSLQVHYWRNDGNHLDINSEYYTNNPKNVHISNTCEEKSFQRECSSKFLEYDPKSSKPNSREQNQKTVSWLNDEQNCGPSECFNMLHKARAGIRQIFPRNNNVNGSVQTDQNMEQIQRDQNVEHIRNKQNVEQIKTPHIDLHIYNQIVEDVKKMILSENAEQQFISNPKYVESNCAVNGVSNISNVGNEGSVKEAKGKENRKPFSDTDISLHMNALAMKYTADGEFSIENRRNIVQSTTDKSSDGNNVSIATMRYLERYQLLPQFRQTQTNDYCDQRDFISKQTHEYMSNAKANFDPEHFSKILDMTAMKHQL